MGQKDAARLDLDALPPRFDYPDRPPERLLDQFACLEVDQLTAKASAALRREHRWKLADSIQAALALNNGLQLVTRNHRHFRPAKYAFVIVPYTV